MSRASAPGSDRPSCREGSWSRLPARPAPPSRTRAQGWPEPQWSVLVSSIQILSGVVGGVGTELPVEGDLDLQDVRQAQERDVFEDPGVAALGFELEHRRSRSRCIRSAELLPPSPRVLLQSSDQGPEARCRSASFALCAEHLLPFGVLRRCHRRAHLTATRAVAVLLAGLGSLIALEALA